MGAREAKLNRYQKGFGHKKVETKKTTGNPPKPAENTKPTTEKPEGKK